MSILKFFLPKDKVFFSLFEQASANLESLAGKLVQVVNEPDFNKRSVVIKEMKDLEQQNDKLTHTIFVELGKNFITPFDREDIHSLATALDDIADYIHGSASRIELYNVKEFSKTMEMLSEVIVKQVIEIDAAVKDMKNMRNAQRVREALIRVNSLENHADDLFDEAIGRLFAEEVPALELIKIKEVLANLETANDKCEDVANVIESILVKNS